MTDTPESKIAEALAKAQAEMKNAVFNKENPHYRNKYADLSAIRDASLKVLAKHGLAITQVTGFHESTFVLFTRLLHTSGETIESVYPLPQVMEKPQVMGSALSYARRYSWTAMCGLSAAEDDDADRAQTELTGQRNHGPAEPVPGKLNKTLLDACLRRFTEDLATCSDEAMLIALMNGKVKVSGKEYSVPEVLTQCQSDRPSWWWTKEGSDSPGIKDRIDAKRKEVTKPAEFPGIDGPQE